MEDIGPNAFRGPSNEPVIKRLAWSINIRRIDPTAAGFEHVNDAADDPSVSRPSPCPTSSRASGLLRGRGSARLSDGALTSFQAPHHPRHHYEEQA